MSDLLMWIVSFLIRIDRDWSRAQCCKGYLVRTKHWVLSPVSERNQAETRRKDLMGQKKGMREEDIGRAKVMFSNPSECLNL